jgi:hypothetical protein
MRTIDYNGASLVMDLLDRGVPLRAIVDRYGRPVHADAEQFMSYHRQAKRMLIQMAERSAELRERLRKLDSGAKRT